METLTAIWRVARVPLAVAAGWLVLVLSFVGLSVDFEVMVVALPPLCLAVALAAARGRWIAAAPRARLWLAGLAIVGALPIWLLAMSSEGVIDIDRGLRNALIPPAILLPTVFLIALTWFARPDAGASGPAEPPQPGDVERFEESLAPHLSARTAALASQMVAEAERLRRLSVLALSGVATLIVFAVLIVLFAGWITSLDLTGADPLIKADAFVRQTQERYDAALSRQRRLTRALEQPERLSELSFGTFIPADDLAAREEAARNELQTLETLAPELEAFAKDARELAQRVRTRDIEGGPAEGEARGGGAAQSTDALIASAVTRFGVIFVLMFLAQALINLNRYALRLAAFHRSRAYMLALSDGDIDVMERTSRTLSADHVNLGREPRAPLDEAKRLAEIARDLKP